MWLRVMVLLALAAALDAQSVFTNPDFEKGSAGAVPEGWFVPSAFAGWQAVWVGAELVREAINGRPGVEFALQTEQLGTGHAVMVCRELLADYNGPVLIVTGKPKTPVLVSIEGRDLQSHALEDWMENGYRSLKVMDMHLSKNDYFVAGRFTIADIALYGFAHVAHQCDFDLGRYPAVRDWLDRVAAEPGYVPMDWQREPALVG